MDLHTIRQDTVGCADKIFLNSAGGSLMPEIVVKTMIDHIYLEQEYGAYEAADRNAKKINKFYKEAAKLINAKPENMAFTVSSTDAYAKALSSIQFVNEDVIITTNDDYISNQIAFFSLQKKLGIKIVRVKNHPDHELDLEDLEDLVKKHHPKLVAVTHIPTNSGLIQNVEGAGEICRRYDVLYLVDACQSVGQLAVDVDKIGCDFLTATGRKFMRGPRGTGFLYVSDKVLERELAPVFLDMNGAEWTEFDDYKLLKTAKRFEHWETSISSILGFTEAAKYANRIGLQNIEIYNRKLAEKLRIGLQNNGLRTLDEGRNLGSNVTFCASDGSIDRIYKVLKENNVYFSVSNKSNALIDFTLKNINSAIRLSPHYFNTSEEIEEVIKMLEL
ncbi:aminotransferase class V-fold PLP-dependent enzyme [Chryseobacterium herbae]|uniref:Aminotransferase class V-fold PLP-dependent enzyme n=1 Tax=Chryseobacterium herbae TaxID=2976476 RepID=A0ABT2IYS6_9FLAO|nr:aminotransferase class V-fold PLP-dependent enzyme [Chryseobacterium sp. pc1-10]MCT2564001.1 aminotransferase class V-fold PLP-dependent enzyme [Chryseobacterium sp. pc1-10]